MDTLLPENIFTATGEGARANTRVLALTYAPPTLTMRYQVTQPTPTLVIPARNRE